METSVLDILSQALVVATQIASPLLVAALAVGIVVSLLQTITQIQEMTLAFVPKFAAVAGVIVVAGHWMLRELVEFTTHLYTLIPALIR